ncbi:unnamed protein product, partial [Prorocentrum cordatum]
LGRPRLPAFAPACAEPSPRRRPHAARAMAASSSGSGAAAATPAERETWCQWTAVVVLMVAVWWSTAVAVTVTIKQTVGSRGNQMGSTVHHIPAPSPPLPQARAGTEHTLSGHGLEGSCKKSILLEQGGC